MSTADSLDRFIARYLGAVTPPPEPFDPEWRSPCEQGAPFAAADGERRIAWRPVRRDDPVHDLFSGLERALELELHADLKTYHALAKRQQRSPFTAFFANTDPDSDYFLSVDNATGQVLLEQPGRPPLRVVADNLASFLDSLEPPTAP